MEYLLGEIAVDGPEHRAEAVKFNDGKLEWPEGWWAVSDDQFAYLGFFQFEADAWAYRLYLVNLRMNAKEGRARYAKADKGIEADENADMAKLEEDVRKLNKRRDKLNARLKKEMDAGAKAVKSRMKNKVPDRKSARPIRTRSRR